MASVALERNFSDLLRKSGEVLDEVDRQDVLLAWSNPETLAALQVDNVDEVFDELVPSPQ